MRVLHVTADYTLGGTETVLLALARNRDCCPSMEPEFLCFRDGMLQKQLRAAGVHVSCIGEVRLRQPASVLRARKIFREMLQERKYDLVIYHQYAWMPLIFEDLARRAGIATFRWYHNEIEKTYWPEIALRTLHPRFPKLSIFCSDFTRLSVAPRGRSETVYTPVTPPSQAPCPEERLSIRKALGARDTDIVFIQVSRIAPRKGLEQHLRALGLLRDLPDCVCWIVGGADNDEQRGHLEYLKQLAVELGIPDRVKFLGKRIDVPKLLAAADVFCQPNVPPPEPFGIVFIEALYAGLPVVTSAIGGALEIVTPAIGRLVPPNDIEQLARILGELATDAQLRASFRLTGPQRARELCDPAIQIAKLGNIALRESSK